jgi:hypothetical protein
MTDLLLRNGWRVCFLLAGGAILAGGPLHPDGTMADMLADPNWLPSHALMTLGFVMMWAGLVLWGRTPANAPRVRAWLRPAVAATMLQAIDMALHTAAMVDHDRLVAGLATPVLTMHLWMTAVVYPVFGAMVVAFLVAAGRDRALGSWWIAWLGIIGAAGHGAAGPLVVVWEIPWATALFPLIVLVGLWMILAACWPARAAVYQPKAASTHA